jgi:hypothetical protein
LGCRPLDLVAADNAAMLALPPVPPTTGSEHTLRLPRDHHVRMDGNDYSVHPAAVGRRVLVRADLNRVRVLCEGSVVADHERPGLNTKPSPIHNIWPLLGCCAVAGSRWFSR